MSVQKNWRSCHKKEAVKRGKHHDLAMQDRSRRKGTKSTLTLLLSQARHPSLRTPTPKRTPGLRCPWASSASLALVMSTRQAWWAPRCTSWAGTMVRGVCTMLIGLHVPLLSHPCMCSLALSDCCASPVSFVLRIICCITHYHSQPVAT